MPIVPLHGHAALRRRLLEAASRDVLPASLLLQGPRGVGKQRLGLWLGQALLCEGPMGERPDGEPCGRCRHCRYAVELTHPDLHWYFPRPRLKDSDPSPADIQADLAGARTDRLERHGLYGPSSGLEGLFVAAVRSLVQQAAVSPALARRKVFVLGDADRLVAQEGSDQAANALLKLLEEPPADTVLILTSSEPGALLPTIRSRVVAVRVAPLPPADVAALLERPEVQEVLKADGQRDPVAALAERVGGAPGALFGGAAGSAAAASAQRILDAVTRGGRPERLKAAFVQGAAGARGAYSDTLDALTVALRDLARDTAASDPRRALGAARAVDAVERAKARAAGNVSPQLLTAQLVRELAGELG
ncbi:hypothetical protein [Roseisolibacter sp. H3M3-2]|uniref:DNA polymerase III subunit n=1 Tax=Roseisolibacter sp. H3M3-2 TaxID=3031323 RepID=UPI0023DBCA0A|nr:hypothetical protein [Roseisolibacter sp. H3M3-2]MDF1502091.1 hypothetical protein [Roseisolibacter sp. H3M3-2]